MFSQASLAFRSLLFLTCLWSILPPGSSISCTSLHGADGAAVYDGYVTLPYDGKGLNGVRIEGDAAPQQVEPTFPFSGASSRSDAWLSFDRALSDFDLWVEHYSEGADSGTGRMTYGFRLSEDSRIPYGRMRTWNIPTIAGTAASPALLHISRRGNDIVFRSAPVGGEWKRELSDVCDGQLENRAAIRLNASRGESLRIRKITMGEAGFKSLFNGKDLSGWTGTPGEASESWSAEQGELRCNGIGKTWLRSAQHYGDFNLSFDYKLNAGGNSGLFIRVPPDGNHHRENSESAPAGLEIQLLDDAAEQYKSLKPYQYSASVYDIVGASPLVSRPAGEWNAFQIDANGDRLQIWHNGEKVVDADERKHPLLALRMREGFLGLQNHSSVISFRNIRIGRSLGN